MHLHDILRARLLAGLSGQARESRDSLVASEWSAKFERLMRNRLLVGRFRYGRMDRADARDYDRVGSAIRRLERYQETGNQEYLVDAANLCLLEFEHGTHPKRHFEAIDDGEHVGRG